MELLLVGPVRMDELGGFMCVGRDVYISSRRGGNHVARPRIQVEVFAACARPADRPFLAAFTFMSRKVNRGVDGLSQSVDH